MDTSNRPNLGNGYRSQKPHRLRNTFILATAVAFTGLVATFIFGIRHIEDDHIQEILQEEFRVAKTGVSIQVGDTEKLLAALSDAICLNQTTQKLWLEGDRDKLLAHIIPLYETFFQTADVTHCYFHTIDGVNFLRAHRPPDFGDKIDRASLQEAMKTGKPSYGMELGPFGTLTFRYVHPWYIDGKLTGYVELGKEVDSTYRGATALLGGSSALLLDKKNLTEEDWNKGMEFLQRSGDWNQYRDYVVVGRYPENHLLSFVKHLLQKESKTGDLPSESYFELEGKTLQIGALELKDMTGNPVGYFVFERDVTASLAEARHVIKVLVASTVFVAALIAFLGAWLLSKVERQVNREHQRVEEQLAVESLQNNIIARFVDYEPQKWETLVNQSLQDVCEFVVASAAYSIGYSESEKKLSDIYGWSTTHGTEARTFFQGLKFEDAHWWIERLGKGEPIVISGDTIPEEAKASESIYRLFKTKTLLAVPMFYSGNVRGCLLISHREHPMHWQPKQIQCIRSIANILATAIVRHRVEVAVREYTEKLAQNNIHLKQARADAEEAARTKSEFLANMSHEIRTPMTAILGFAENLIAPTINDEDRMEAADTIFRNGNHLLQLINDILDFSKVEAGQIKLEIISCPPTRIISDVTLLMAKRAEEKGIFLKSKFQGAMPEECQSDPTRLRQILLNLVGNSIKFTDHGGVTLFSKVEKTARDKGLFICEVSDTGIGMDESQLQRVFQPFTQADSSVARRYGGTGLGLAISRRMAEAMGGTLTAESTPNVSTIFRLVIPIIIPEGTTWIDDPVHYKFVHAVEPTEKPMEGSTGRIPYKILLAEDGKDNQRLISVLLRKEGAIVEIVENGSEAIRAMEQAEMAGEPFDIVLMDMQMPVLDGYTATRRLRQAGFHLPIIALTASVMPEDRNKCISAGCNDYASKPINREMLFAKILQNLEKSHATL